MGKMIVENSLKLSASSFKKWGCFDNPNQFRSGTVKWGYGESEHARIDYELNLNVYGLRLMYKYRVCDGEWKDQDYYVEIVSTPCYFGGLRYWFKCPSCGIRVGCLYSVSGYFACRKCNNLAYESNNELKSARRYEPIFRLYKLEDKVEALRVRYYKGKPTKRFANLSRKMDECWRVLGSMRSELD